MPKREVTGLPVVLLHGWGADSSRFKILRQRLEDKGFDVWVSDLPGFGKAPAPPKAWGLREYAEWVNKKTKECGFKDYLLIGHSFGGSVALKLAADTSIAGNVMGLVLISSAGIRKKKSLKTRLFGRLSGVGKFIFRLPGLSRLYDSARRLQYRLLGVYDYYRARGIMKEIFLKVTQEDLRELLPQIKTPTLILWGEEDRMTPVADARLIHQRISDSELKIYPEKDHLFVYHEVDPLIEDILDWRQRKL